jgi:hypothetical protein
MIGTSICPKSGRENFGPQTGSARWCMGTNDAILPWRNSPHREKPEARGSRSTRHLTPIPPQTLALMAEKGMSPSDPILMRAYKKESELEVWKRRADGKYASL